MKTAKRTLAILLTALAVLSAATVGASAAIVPQDSVVIIFDGNGGKFGSGDSVATTTTVTADNSLTYAQVALPAPAKENAAFIGWYDAVIGGNALSASAMVSATTWYAHWTATYTVTFDAKDGAVNPTKKVYPVGQPYGSLPEAKKEYYTFAGWYTAPTGGDQVTKDNTPASDLTLYARYNEQTDLQKWQEHWHNNLPGGLRAGVKCLPLFLQQICYYVLFGWVFDVVLAKK